MNELEQKLINRIRESEDPDETMTYIEELLFNPEKFQEALTALAVQQAS